MPGRTLRSRAVTAAWCDFFHRAELGAGNSAAKACRVPVALSAGLMLCWATPALAQLSFDLPAPQLTLNLSLAATASSIGPEQRFNADLFRSSSFGPAVLPLLPGQLYALQRSGELHQSYTFEGDEDNPGSASGYADLHFNGQAEGRAGFGSLGVAASMTQSGSGFQFAMSPSGYQSGPGSGSSAAESRASAVDSFTVLSASRPIGTAVVVDFGVSVHGSVSSAAVSDGGGPFAIGNLAVIRQVQVFRPGSADPVWSQTRDFWWQAGEQETGAQTDVDQRLPWLLPLQVGDAVSLRLTLLASVTSQGGIPPGGDVAGGGLFDASARVDAMNSAHASLMADAPDIQLLTASGHDYAASPVPEPGVLHLLVAGFTGLLVWIRRRGGGSTQARASARAQSTTSCGPL